MIKKLKPLPTADQAKNYLARELGNQQRFLVEYGYSQIVDLLDKGGFLREPISTRESDHDK